MNENGDEVDILPQGAQTHPVVGQEAILNRLYTGRMDAKGNAYCDRNLSVLGDTSVGGLLRTNQIKIFSDRRTKRNISKTDFHSSILHELEVKSFVLKSSDRKQIGFIAQEVQKIFPIAVDDQDGILSVDPMALIALIVKYIQAKEEMSFGQRIMRCLCCFF